MFVFIWMAMACVYVVDSHMSRDSGYDCDLGNCDEQDWDNSEIGVCIFTKTDFAGYCWLTRHRERRLLRSRLRSRQKDATPGTLLACREQSWSVCWRR